MKKLEWLTSKWKNGTFLSVIGLLFLCVILKGCGSGAQVSTDEGAGGGAQDIATISVGPIDAFGSIYVNGIRYSTEGAMITVNGDAVEDQSSLQAGMYVRVRGTLESSGESGIAEEVEYFDNLKGPLIDAVVSQNEQYTLLTSLGKTVLIDPDDTQFGTGLTYETLGQSNWIRVSGKTLDDGTILASRIESLVPETEETVRFIASIESKTDNQFVMQNGLTVTADASIISEYEAGQFIEVVGTINGARVTAIQITSKESFSPFISVDPDDGQSAVIEGEISNYLTTTGTFEVAGVTVNALNSTVSPSFMSLSDGLTVKVQGVYNASQLNVTELYIQALVEEATVTGVSQANNQVTLMLEAWDEEVTVTVTEETLYGGETDSQGALTFDGLAVGHRVFVRMEHNLSNTLVAQEITRIAEFTGTTSSDPAAVSSVNEAQSVQNHDSLILTTTDTLTVALNPSGAGQFDRHSVAGTFTPDGTLDINGSITAQVGQSYDILDWGDITADAYFEDVQLPALTGGLAWDLGALYDTGVVKIVAAPGSIAVTPTLWLDANDVGSYKEANSEISRWVDKTGNNLNAFSSAGLPGLSGDGPTLTFDTDLARYGFQFVGNDAGTVDSSLQIRDQGALDLTGDKTLFVVVKHEVDDPNQSTAFIEKWGNDLNDGWSYYFSDSRERVVYWGGGGSNQQYILSDAGYTDINNRMSVVSVRKNNNTVTHHFDGALSGQGNSTVAVSISVDFATIGASATTGSYEANLDGVIYEIIVYDSALSDADWQAVETYLLNKY